MVGNTYDRINLNVTGFLPNNSCLVLLIYKGADGSVLEFGLLYLMLQFLVCLQDKQTGYFCKLNFMFTTRVRKIDNKNRIAFLSATKPYNGPWQIMRFTVEF